jgi:methyl-accepting chemotaxis protein
MVDQMSMSGFTATRTSDDPAPAATWDLTTTPPWSDADSAEQLVELAAVVADVVGGIHRAVLAFSSGGARSAVSMGAVSRQVHAIRTGLEAVAVAVEALHSGADEAARAGTESARVCTDLAAEVQRGSSVLARVVEAVEAMQSQRDRIERLADQLAEIATFSGVIKEVADKTRMLALNARIEAARAGTHGAAFRIVADEIGKLAADSDAQTRRIATVVATTRSDLDPLREAIDAGREQGDGLAEALEARETLRRIGELAERLTAPAEHVAAAAESQLQALAEISGHMEGTVAGVAEVDDHAMTMSTEAFALSSSAEEVYELIRPFQTNAFVDRATDITRGLARGIGDILGRAVESGRVSRQAILALRYEEIAGTRIASLGRLFDVSRVPPTGFDPPKYATAYDALVDEELTELYDRQLAEHPWLTFALGSDLNVYSPAHNSRFCADWTGDREADLLGNRVKRMWLDAPPLVRAARFGLGGSPLPAAQAITSAELRTAGCDLAEPAGGEQRRLLQTYARDTGAIFTVLSVPVYVLGERWGTSIIGWDPDAVAR